MNIVTGERIQQLCDVYLGEPSDFYANPVIANQPEKHCHLDSIVSPFANPRYVFCYSHRVSQLSRKVQFFSNEFILVTHNSDGEICECDETMDILNCSNLVKWYAQNTRMVHVKLAFLPIGIANSQWPHGNLENFHETNRKPKTKKVYFNFNIYTNLSKRMYCFNKLKNKLEWLETVPPDENVKRLSEYEFCICPEGNGVDTHRLWEALYVKTIPIVIKSEFTDILVHNKIPVVVLNDWGELDENKLNYSFDANNIQQLLCFSEKYLV